MRDFRDAKVMAQTLRETLPTVKAWSWSPKSRAFTTGMC
jgi:hypothetical protein